jgi:uncharacterized Zn finger protein
MWYRDFFPRSRPRPARGGIKSQSKRGAFGQSWWAQRWIAVLESFDIGARLGRGRSYARGGQVLSIEVDKGEVTARVQGSRPKPYDVTIAVTKLTARQWQDVVQALSGQALFTAKLLAGEMPPDIEQVFADIGLSLFPQKSADLVTDCSCPDWSNPCKHIAAVYYLLGEEFDRDPFLLFRLRGLDRAELLQRLSRAAPSPAPPVKAASRGEGSEAEATSVTEPSPVPPEPLSAEPSLFWTGGILSEDAFGAVQPPPVSGAWLRRLGAFPFWRGETGLKEALAPLYQAAAAHGFQAFLGERLNEVDA